jgi:tRNA(Arg) A34 adenosine deaminase TadA
MRCAAACIRHRYTDLVVGQEQEQFGRYPKQAASVTHPAKRVTIPPFVVTSRAFLRSLARKNVYCRQIWQAHTGF